jgi:hypothetical protein
VNDSKGGSDGQHGIDDTGELAPDDLVEADGASEAHLPAAPHAPHAAPARNKPASLPPLPAPPSQAVKPASRPPPAPPSRSAKEPSRLPPPMPPRNSASVVSRGAMPPPAPPAPPAAAPPAPASHPDPTPRPIAPSAQLVRDAERPLDTTPGAASLGAQRALQTAQRLEAHLATARGKGAAETPRLARLLVEQGLAFERAIDLTRARAAYDEAARIQPEQLAAVRGALRALALQRDDPRRARARTTIPIAPTEPSEALRSAVRAGVALVDHELRLATTQARRADLQVERARALEREPRRDHRAILEALRKALTLAPTHAEAALALASALQRAIGDASGRATSEPLEGELAAQLGRLAAAYGDTELVASLHASRARILERHGELAAAEEAYVSALAADGRVGPTREAYKRLLLARGGFAKLRDALAEEAGRESDRARSVRLLFEAARVSVERLADDAGAIDLLEHAAGRAPTDATIDGRVLDELVRLQDARHDTAGVIAARRARIAHEASREMRAIELRRLAEACERTGDGGSAIEALERARQIEPLDEETLRSLDRLYETGSPGSAKQATRLAMWLDVAAKGRDVATRAEAYVRAARVAELGLHQPEAAIAHLRAAWTTDPTRLDALDALARLLHPRSTTPGADDAASQGARALVDLYRHAALVATEPARAIAYLEKVAALLEDELGEPARAAEVYGEILRREPKRRGAILGRQRALERAGDAAALAKALEEEASQAETAEHRRALRLRAAHVWSAGANDAERALTAIRAVLAEVPDDPSALRAQLDAQERAGRWEEVVATLRALLPREPATSAERRALAVELQLRIADLSQRRLARDDDAIAALRAVLELDAKHPVATRELASALRARGTWRAAAELDEAIAATTDDTTTAARHWVRAAELWEGRLDDDARAQAAYGRALSAHADDLAAWEGLARLAERRRAHKELEAAYRLRIDQETGARRVALRLALAELLVRRGDRLDVVAQELDALLAEAPARVQALELAATVHRLRGDDAALVRTLTQLAQVLRDPLAKRGVLWELVRLQEAVNVGAGPRWDPIAAYLLLFELDPTDEAALDGIVRLATSRVLAGAQSEEDGTPSGAGLPNVRGLLAFGLRKQASAARDDGFRNSVELRLADLLEDSIARPEIDEALALYRSVLARDAESPTACEGLRRLGARLADATAELEGEVHAAAIAPEPPRAVEHWLKAAALAPRVPAERGGGDAGAIDLVGHALTVSPDSEAAARANLELLERLGRHELLVERLGDASARATRPDRVVALARAGARVAHDACKSTPRAITLLERARLAAPEDPVTLVELGTLQMEQQAWAEGARTLEEALVRASKEERALRLRALRLLADAYAGPLGDQLRAAERYRQLVSLDARDVGARRALATALLGLGRGAEAADELGRLGVDPAAARENRVEALLELADVRTARHEQSQAEQALRDAIALEPDPKAEPFARLEAWHARFGTGDASFAEALRALVDGAGGDPRWRVRLGQIEVHRLGDPASGLAHLVAAVAALPEDDDARLALGEAQLASGNLEESAASLRAVLARTPVHPGALDAALRAQQALGRRDEASVIEEARAYLGYGEGLAAFRARTLPATPPRPEVLEDAAIVAALLPSDAQGPAFEVLTALSDQLGKIFPADLAALGVTTRDRLAARAPNPLRVIVDRAATALGVAQVDLYVHEARASHLMVENLEPPAIILPASIRALPELEAAFAVGRLVAKVAMRAWLVDKLPARALQEVIYATVEPFGARVPRDPGRDELSRRIQKALSRKGRKQIEELAPRVVAFDAEALVRGVERAAAHAAYLLTGDLVSALDHLRRGDPTSDPATAGTPSCELLRFALSSEATAMRRRLGTSWT